MARLMHDGSGNHTGVSSHHATVMDASSGHALDLPGRDYVADAQFLRDGQDLLIHPAHGEDIVIKNYFSADPAPLLGTHDGSGLALTPDLVHSFVQPAHGVQYAQAGTMDDASPVGAIREVSGEASVHHANGTVQTAAVGTPIYEGDVIETKAHGAVNITFIDKTTFAVSDNAKMAIDKYVFDPASQHGENSFSVLRGLFVFTSGLIGHADPDDVKIHTPVGSIGIRGTTIMGSISPDGASHVTVVEGAIVVSNAAGEQTLSQQFETVSLQGMNQPIASNGVLSSADIASQYNVLRTVSGALFSSFGDMAAPHSTPAQPDAQTPASHSDAAPANTPADAHAAAQQDISPAQTSFDAAFDASAGVHSTDVLTNATLDSLSVQTASSQTVTMLAPTALSTDTTATTDTTTTTAAVAGTDTTTVNAPVQQAQANGGGGGGTNSGVVDLNLNTAISSGSGANWRFIPSIAGGQGHGAAVAALGDYNHDGHMDYTFVDNQLTNNSLYLDDNLGNHHIYNLTNAPFSFATDARHIALGSAGDVNNDGSSDFIAGAFNADGVNFSSGAVFVGEGSTNGSAGYAITGFANGQMAGYSVAGIGDYNGDGLNDILIGAPQTSGSGSAYIIFGNAAGISTDVGALNASQGLVIPSSPTIGSMGFGSDVAGLGDVNHDGYSDLAVTNPGSGEVQIYFGNASNALSGPLTINGLSGTADSNPFNAGLSHIQVMGLGDMNNGGKSDFGILDTGANKFSVFYSEVHGMGTGSFNISTSDATITASTGRIVSANTVGDFNGDGHSDIAMAVRNGAQMDVYVVYGGTGLSGTIDLSTLADSGMYHMSLDLSSSQFNLSNPTVDPVNISLSAAGDLNGDGFNDMLIGLPNLDNGNGANSGGLLIVYGQAEAGGVNATGVASANGQALVGTAGPDILTNSSASYSDLSFHGGGGNDYIKIYGASMSERFVDGGTGNDTLMFLNASANIDLRGLGTGNLNNIENINLSGAAQTLTLGIDQIFNLLHESETKDLHITASSSATLNIDTNSSANSLSGAGFVSQVDSGGYHVWTAGSYTLYIDATNISATNVSNTP